MTLFAICKQGAGWGPGPGRGGVGARRPAANAGEGALRPSFSLASHSVS